ncbi:MAG TPA: septal ring lytic transglycosylase RlpA family protein [Terriglobia bacterium]|nr:septal ring lytic transglycosylase RlpA family protein [Terriglobia bacterium]
MVSRLRRGESRGTPLARALAAALTAALSCGCVHRHHHQQAGNNPPPAPTAGQPRAGNQPAAPIVQGEKGLASWYGHPYHGRPTSSGEIYNMYAMTAAHRTLPFGTQVRVHDLDNGQAVEVRINDRGPFVDGRIIDLSYSAAKAMGMLGAGVARVQLEILNPAVLKTPGIFAVQVGAFRERSNADRLRDRIAERFQPVIIQSFDRGDGLYHRVRVGQESTEEAAQELGRQLQQAGLATDVFVVRLN